MKIRHIHFVDSVKWIFDTEDGAIHPGDLYSIEHDKSHCGEWDNCDGVHWYLRLPNNEPWQLTGRARNCTKPDDKLHRCWVLEGEPENFNISKSGNTCGAGAGSIASGDFHGWLRNGELIEV